MVSFPIAIFHLFVCSCFVLLFDHFLILIIIIIIIFVPHELFLPTLRGFRKVIFGGVNLLTKEEVLYLVMSGHITKAIVPYYEFGLCART